MTHIQGLADAKYQIFMTLTKIKKKKILNYQYTLK